MKASFMLTTQRQNCNLRNGRVLGLQGPKTHVCWKANWRRCWFVSLTKRVSYTGNLSHLEWRSMQASTVMFWEGYLIMCGARGHRNWKTIPSLSTTTMPRLTGPLKFRSFWQRTMTLIPHPPYSPDLAACDLFLFPKLKLEEIQEESQPVLDTIPKRGFQGCFQAWQKRWDHCIRAKDEYFEGDGGI